MATGRARLPPSHEPSAAAGSAGASPSRMGRRPIESIHRQLRNQRVRVLHGPINVGNQPWVLSRFERKLGVRSELVVNNSTWFGYQADKCLSQSGSRSLGSLIRRFGFAMSAPWRYDVLHYYFGRSFLGWEGRGLPKPLWFLDLKIARKLG